MKVIMVDVISLNGKITKGEQGKTHAWTSPEDWEEFVCLRDRSDVLVMDVNTYEVLRPRPTKTLLRLVLTHNPDKYKQDVVPGQLEFLSATPKELVSQLAGKGYKQLLVAGGSQVNSDFLAAGLVEDLYLTFEPVLFGTGRPLLAERPLDVKLKLESIRHLNEHGTLFAHYTITK